MIFQDRTEAGYLLSFDLMKYKDQDVIVLAIPHGGVPVAIEVAAALNAPMDLLLVRNIGLPFRGDLAAGAICEHEDPVWNDRVLSQAGLQPDDFHSIVKFEEDRIHHELEKLRDGKMLSSVGKKTVILVDDGMDTGSTMVAAVKFLKKKKVAKIIVATPVASITAIKRLREKVDDIVVLQEEENFSSTSAWYLDSPFVPEEKVTALLKKGFPKKNDVHL